MDKIILTKNITPAIMKEILFEIDTSVSEKHSTFVLRKTTFTHVNKLFTTTNVSFLEK